MAANVGVNEAIASVSIDGHKLSCAGSVAQFVAQFKGVLITLAWSALASMVILKVVQASVGLRVEEDEESLGLDLSQHGESAYND